MSTMPSTLEQWMEWLTPEANALVFLPTSAAQSHGLLPMRLTATQLICAASESVDLARVGELQFQVQRQILVVKVPASALDLALDRAYGRRVLPQATDLLGAVTDSAKPLPADRACHADLGWSTEPLQVIAVTSGKGGVGKTTVSANLGLALSQLGRRVAMIDGDFAMPNLHVALGMNPKRTLNDVMEERATLWTALERGPTGVRIIAGELGAGHLASLGYNDLCEKGLAYSQFGAHFDVLLVDTAAGATASNLSLLQMADEVLVVVTPEPSSLQDAYAMIHMTVHQRPGRKIGILVNQARSESQGKLVYLKLMSFLRVLPASISYRGCLMDSSHVRKGAQSRQPVLLSQPRCDTSRRFQALARAMVGLKVVDAPRGIVSRVFRSAAGA
ncbi:MAG: P-loop NTPase [Armatimonadetes bacterium]|nr:P-loop NTPase [Armatimonadota bacterium]